MFSNTLVENSKSGTYFYECLTIGATAKFMCCCIEGIDGGIHMKGSFYTINGCYFEGNREYDILSDGSGDHMVIVENCTTELSGENGNFLCVWNDWARVVSRFKSLILSINKKEEQSLFLFTFLYVYAILFKISVSSHYCNNFHIIHQS